MVHRDRLFYGGDRGQVYGEEVQRKMRSATTRFSYSWRHHSPGIRCHISWQHRGHTPLTHTDTLLIPYIHTSLITRNDPTNHTNTQTRYHIHHQKPNAFHILVCTSTLTPDDFIWGKKGPLNIYPFGITYILVPPYHPQTTASIVYTKNMRSIYLTYS